MWVARWRDPRVLAAVALAAVIFALLALVDLVPVVTYEHQVLFHLPWGTATGQVGLADGEDGSFYGPRSFVVHDGQVYVADTFNARVQVFDLAGRLQQVIPLSTVPAMAAPHLATHDPQRPPPQDLLAAFATSGQGDDLYRLGPNEPWINDLAIGSQGNLYLADSNGPAILQLDAQGNWQATIDVTGAISNDADDALWLLERLALDRRGLVYLAHTYFSQHLYTRSLVRFNPATARFVHLSTAALREGGRLGMEEGSLLPVPANSFALAADGSLYVESPGADPFARLVRHYSGDSRALGHWTLRHDHAITEASLIGVDRYNQAYLLVNPGKEHEALLRLDRKRDGSARIVSLYNENTKVRGDQLADASRQNGAAHPFIVKANVYGRVDRNGSVYLAAADSEGWRLEALTASWRRQLRLAGGRKK